MAKKSLPTIGVSDYTILPIVENDDGTTRYLTPVRLPGTVQVAPTDSGGNDTFDADNGAYEVETYLENIGHELTNADIPQAVDALLRGITLTNGVLDVTANIKAPMFGVAWKVLKSDGSYRYVIYYKGRYSFGSNVGGKTKPSSGASEKQTAQAKFIAIPNADGKYYCYEDSARLTAKEIDLLDEKYLGAAFPVGLTDILATGGKISENMGVYKWTGTDTLVAGCPADNGVITISFDLLGLAETRRYTRFSIADKSRNSIISFKCCEYGTEGDYYEVIVGDYTATDRSTVATGLYTGAKVTDYTHIVCTINLNAGNAEMLIYNDVNNKKALYTGEFTPNGVSTLEIYSNHTYDDRRISVKRLRFEAAGGEDNENSITENEEEN